MTPAPVDHAAIRLQASRAYAAATLAVMAWDSISIGRSGIPTSRPLGHSLERFPAMGAVPLLSGLAVEAGQPGNRDRAA